jgi:hypothetical protein
MLESLKGKIKNRLGVPSVIQSLILANRNGFAPKVIYDIGAYEGTWTIKIANVFPKANLLEDIKNQMTKWGFQTYDICFLMCRILDKALYQTDILFIKKDSHLIFSKRWA